MNMATATTEPLPAPGLTWGIKASFIAYIAGLPDGTVSAASGASEIRPGLFHFSFDAADYDPARGAGVLRFRGDVRLAGHHGMLFVRLLDPWMEISGGRGVLSISTGDGAGRDRIDVGTLTAASPAPADGSLLWAGMDVLITSGGSELFDGQYAAGQPMDPLTVRIPAARA